MKINCTSFFPLMRRRIVETNWFDEARMSLIEPKFITFLWLICQNQDSRSMFWGESDFLVIDYIP